MSIDDLEAYQARWEPTASAHYGAHEVHVPGGTATGGTTLLEALRLAERAGVRETGPVHESAESLYWMSRIGYLLWVADFRLGELSDRFPELATDPEGRRTPANADQLWQRLQTDAWNEFVEADPLTAPGGSGPSHTDAIVAVDDLFLNGGLSCGGLATCVENCQGDMMCQTQCFMDASMNGAAPGKGQRPVRHW